MTIHKSKVAVAGCGLVGSSIAFSLLVQGLCDELLLLTAPGKRRWEKPWI